MKSSFPGRQARWVAAGLLALMLAVLLLFISELSWRYAWAGSVLQGIEPRYARLAGLLESGAEIGEQQERAAASLSRLAYAPDDELVRLGTDLQQQIRRIAEEVGVQVSGSQILPAREEGDGLMVVSVGVTLMGDVAQVSELFLRLEERRPPVLMDRVVVQAQRGRRGAQNDNVTVQATMVVLRRNS